MDPTFTEEQRIFQRTVRDFLEKECAPAHVRLAREGNQQFSIERWRGLAKLGVVGLGVPEDFGGLGGDETDLVLILEEAGRAALPEPLMETAAMIVPLLAGQLGKSWIDAKSWLERIASGDAVGLLTRYPTGSFDLTLSSVEDDGPGIHYDGRGGELDDDMVDRGAFGSAALLCGMADRVIELAAAYAKERHQFGKPIGSFQAVKHLLADALLGLEFARPVVYRAAWSLATGHADRSIHVSMAKAYASDAVMNAGRAALQVHGAIGYTHEHDLHLWLNKGTALAHAWGTAAFHRERVARILLG